MPEHYSVPSLLYLMKSKHKADWLVIATWYQLTNQLCPLISPWWKVHNPKGTWVWPHTLVWIRTTLKGKFVILTAWPSLKACEAVALVASETSGNNQTSTWPYPFHRVPSLYLWDSLSLTPSNGSTLRAVQNLSLLLHERPCYSFWTTNERDGYIGMRFIWHTVA